MSRLRPVYSGIPATANADMRYAYEVQCMTEWGSLAYRVRQHVGGLSCGPVGFGVWTRNIASRYNPPQPAT